MNITEQLSLRNISNAEQFKDISHEDATKLHDRFIASSHDIRPCPVVHLHSAEIKRLEN